MRVNFKFKLYENSGVKQESQFKTSNKIENFRHGRIKMVEITYSINIALSLWYPTHEQIVSFLEKNHLIHDHQY